MIRLALLAALLAAPAAAAPTPHQRALAAGYKAAFLCSGRWNAGQTPEQIAADDLTGIYPDYQTLMAELPANIDEAARTVSVPFDDKLPPRIAVWRPLLGCAQLPVGAAPDAARAIPRLTPDFATPSLAETDAMPWPLGDAKATTKLPRKTAAGLDKVVTAAFSQAYGSDRTTAVIVLKDGRIVAERYRPGWSMHTPQRTWSVAKSLTSTLIGRAAHLGRIDPNAPAAIPEWQKPGDPRAAITTEQLLRMNSGLFTAGPGNRTDEAYLGGATVPQTAATMPLEHAPGSRFNYSNNDIMLAAYGVEVRLGNDHPGFIFTQLLWPLGMTRTTPETDWQGHFILSSQVWMSARDLARLALLHQNDGMANGQRLLPPGWSGFVADKRGAQPRGRAEGYGAGFWRMDGMAGLPAGTYAMQGNRGQYAIIVPSRGIVVVRRGFDAAGAGFDPAKFAADVLRSLP